MVCFHRHPILRAPNKTCHAEERSDDIVPEGQASHSPAKGETLRYAHTVPVSFREMTPPGFVGHTKEPRLW